MVRKIKIWGPPGCGKTTTLKAEYTKLLLDRYDSDSITLITFRHSSAYDLQKAIYSTKQTEKDTSKHVGTIHSICYKLCGGGEIMLSEDYKDFLSKSGYGVHMSNSSNEDSAYSGNMFDMYTWCRNTLNPLVNWQLYPGSENIDLPESMVMKFFRDFEKYKKDNNKLDFSDMLERIIEKKIMLDTPVLMVDEFQDLTAQMHKIFKMWEAKCEVIIIAGDPNQSIYGFWGGSPSYFLNWKADQDIILGRTYRLPIRIKDLSRKILIAEGMECPNPEAKEGYKDPIQSIRYNEELPIFDNELHLVRCNCQLYGIALMLAESGRLFSDSESIKKKKGQKSGCGWTFNDMNIANAIIKTRATLPLNQAELKAVIEAYPSRYFDSKVSKKELLDSVDSGCGVLLSEIVIKSMLSSSPTDAMERDSRLLTAKIEGILGRKNLITEEEICKIKIMTIHGSKGLQAYAVFLHTYIPKRTLEIISESKDDAEAEARVWFVGVTRATDILYLVEDKGCNYEFPEVC